MDVVHTGFADVGGAENSQLGQPKSIEMLINKMLERRLNVFVLPVENDSKHDMRTSTGEAITSIFLHPKPGRFRGTLVREILAAEHEEYVPLQKALA